MRHHDKLCYIDRLGRIVLETRYASGGPFSDGRAIVHHDARRAIVINREGRVVVESEWDDIRPFSEGLAAACKDGKWGFVDREGQVVIEPQFDSVTAFSEGLAGFELGRTQENLSKGMSWALSGSKGIHRPFRKRRHSGRVDQRKSVS